MELFGIIVGAIVLYFIFKKSSDEPEKNDYLKNLPDSHSLSVQNWVTRTLEIPFWDLFPGAEFMVAEVTAKFNLTDEADESLIYIDLEAILEATLETLLESTKETDITGHLLKRFAEMILPATKEVDLVVVEQLKLVHYQSSNQGSGTEEISATIDLPPTAITISGRFNYTDVDIDFVRHFGQNLLKYYIYETLSYLDLEDDQDELLEEFTEDFKEVYTGEILVEFAKFNIKLEDYTISIQDTDIPDNKQPVHKQPVHKHVIQKQTKPENWITRELEYPLWYELDSDALLVAKCTLQFNVTEKDHESDTYYLFDNLISEYIEDKLEEIDDDEIDNHLDHLSRELKEQCNTVQNLKVDHLKLISYRSDQDKTGTIEAEVTFDYAPISITAHAHFEYSGRSETFAQEFAHIQLKHLIYENLIYIYMGDRSFKEISTSFKNEFKESFNDLIENDEEYQVIMKDYTLSVVENQKEEAIKNSLEEQAKKVTENTPEPSVLDHLFESTPNSAQEPKPVSNIDDLFGETMDLKVDHFDD